MRRTQPRLKRVLGLLTVIALAAAIVAGEAGAGVRSVPDSTWQTDGRVRAIDYSGGVVYIGGSFTHVRPPGGTSGQVVRNHVAAFDAATGSLLPWNPNANGAVRALVVAGSTVYIGGDFSTVGGHARSHVAAVDKAGVLLPWNPRASGTVHAIVRDSAGNPLNRDEYAVSLRARLTGSGRSTGDALMLTAAQAAVVARLLDELVGVYRGESLGTLAHELSVLLDSQLGEQD